jgi:mono/diheme cytochrome c family protein
MATFAHAVMTTSTQTCGKPPNLHGVFLAKSLPSGAPATDEQVRYTIIAGLRTMPAFAQMLSEADASDIVRYMHKLN